MLRALKLAHVVGLVIFLGSILETSVETSGPGSNC